MRLVCTFEILNYCRIDYPNFAIAFPQRIATVTAIEFCEIYVLDYTSFKKYVQINEAIMHKLTETAKARTGLTRRAEEEHKKQTGESLVD